jgi:hypothetical protein
MVYELGIRIDAIASFANFCHHILVSQATWSMSTTSQWPIMGQRYTSEQAYQRCNKLRHPGFMQSQQKRSPKEEHHEPDP